MSTFHKFWNGGGISLPTSRFSYNRARPRHTSRGLFIAYRRGRTVSNDFKKLLSEHIGVEYFIFQNTVTYKTIQTIIMKL